MDTTSRVEGSLAQAVSAIDFATMRRPIEMTPQLCGSIRRAHAEVDSMMDRLTDSQPDAAALRGHITEVERLKRRVEAVQLRLTARAAQDKVPERSGHTDSGSWLAGATGNDRQPSASDAALADALGDVPQQGDGTAPQVGRGSGRRLTSTGTALDAGTIGAAHAKVILRALDDLPEGVTDEQRRVCEDELLRLCTNRSPSQLRRAARRELEAIEPDEAVVDDHEQAIVVSEEEQARDKAAFWIKDNQDGTMTGRFTVPWLSGMTLKKVIDAMTAPRRHQGNQGTDSGMPGGDAQASGGTAPTASADARSSKDRYLDWEHRRGLAFADLLLRLPTDHLHHKVAATILVTTRLSDLMTDLAATAGAAGPTAGAAGSTAGAAGSTAGGTKVAWTDVHGDISAGAARRLACGAGILPTVLGGDSIPLDLGRQKRLFTDNQRMALAGRYDECAAEGCDRPFAWTETHHLRAWEHGGRTDLDNAVPLCGRHHHMIDSSWWRCSSTRGPHGTVSITFRRRT